MHADVQVVIASCLEDLSWAAPLVSAGFAVLAIDKCEHGRDGGYGTSNASRTVPAGIKLVHPHTPNRGRESHTFLWFIVHHLDTLRGTTVFLQGDATRRAACLHHLSSVQHTARSHRRHVDTASLPAEIAAFAQSGASYTSLAKARRALPAIFKYTLGLESVCKVWHAFRSGECKLWSAHLWA